jgi:alcohol dehydrogenase class IV
MSLITYLTRIHFADRVLEDALGEEIARLGLRRPLVLVDAAGEGAEAPDRLADALPATCSPVWMHGCTAGRPRQTLAAARQRAAGQDCDGILGLGGAVALDLARMLGAGGGRPVIAVPTTTASVGLGPLAADPEGAASLPALILCDATLTLGADAAQTAAAGMDALTHCIEAYLGTTWNPPADGIALEGVRRAGAFLERAVADGADLDARRELLAAALNAGLASAKGAGGTEAAARAMEAEAGLGASHGLLNAALLPQMLSFNAPAVAERFAALREALRWPADADLPEGLSRLGQRLGLPTRLGGLGLGRAALRRAARGAAAHPASRTNPRHATEADYLRLYEAAL